MGEQVGKTTKPRFNEVLSTHVCNSGYCSTGYKVGPGKWKAHGAVSRVSRHKLLRLPPRVIWDRQNSFRNGSVHYRELSARSLLVSFPGFWGVGDDDTALLVPSA